MRNKYIETLLDDIECKSPILKGERNGFLLSLMVVSSYAIQADADFTYPEQQFINQFLADTFGETKRAKYTSLLNKLLVESKKYDHRAWTKKIEECTRELIHSTTIDQRLLLVSYVIRIVKADNDLHPQELDVVQNIANWLEVDLHAAKQIQQLNNELIDTWTV